MTGFWREIGDPVCVRRYAPLDQTIGVIGGAAGEVVAAVNTHGHSDHVFGNPRFRGSPIWGHARCAVLEFAE